MYLQCSICLERLNFNCDVISATACGHMFHNNCLTRWTSENSNCPQCRKQIDSRNVVKRLYANVDTSGNTFDGHIEEIENNNLNLKSVLTKLKFEEAEIREICSNFGE